MKAFLTGISFNGYYLYLGWAGLFSAPTEIITLPPGNGRSNACLTQADDSAIISFAFIVFSLRWYWLPSTGVIKKQLGETALGFLSSVMRKEQLMIIESTQAEGGEVLKVFNTYSGFKCVVFALVNEKEIWDVKLFRLIGKWKAFVMLSGNDIRDSRPSWKYPDGRLALTSLYERPPQ